MDGKQMPKKSVPKRNRGGKRKQRGRRANQQRLAQARERDNRIVDALWRSFELEAANERKTNNKKKRQQHEKQHDETMKKEGQKEDNPTEDVETVVKVAEAIVPEFESKLDNAEPIKEEVLKEETTSQEDSKLPENAESHGDPEAQGNVAPIGPEAGAKVDVPETLKAEGDNEGPLQKASTLQESVKSIENSATATPEIELKVDGDEESKEKPATVELAGSSITQKRHKLDVNDMDADDDDADIVSPKKPRMDADDSKVEEKLVDDEVDAISATDKIEADPVVNEPIEENASPEPESNSPDAIQLDEPIAEPSPEESMAVEEAPIIPLPIEGDAAMEATPIPINDDL